MQAWLDRDGSTSGSAPLAGALWVEDKLYGHAARLLDRVKQIGGLPVVRVAPSLHQQVLWREQGTRTAVLQNASAAHLMHFACHGVYDLTNPLGSPLLLADGKTLTLGEMLEQLNLPSAWLVALSACETALVNPAEQADEHFGLALGPLYADAPTVWGTLWAVEDVATGLLMGKAYELLQQGMSKAEALREAQLWLRELTAAEVRTILEAQKAEQPTQAVVARMAAAQLLPVKRKYALRDDSERPFAHPYYWSAFQCVGV